MALLAKEIKAHRDAVHIRQALIWNKSYGYDAEIRKLMGIKNGLPKEDTACNGTGKGAQRARRRKKFYVEFPNCYYCEVQLTRKNRSVDHVVPRSKGGSNGLDNLVTCCKKCNNEKGANLLDANGKIIPQIVPGRQGRPKRKKFALWDWCVK